MVVGVDIGTEFGDSLTDGFGVEESFLKVVGHGRNFVGIGCELGREC